MTTVWETDWSEGQEYIWGEQLKSHFKKKKAIAVIYSTFCAVKIKMIFF